MIASPPPIAIPLSYETLPTTHIALTHQPAGTSSATAVVIVTLNRPKNQNAFTGEMMDDLLRVYAMFDVDERVKVVVLTGAGKTFCAGADLDIGFQGGREKVIDHRDSGGRVVLAIHRCRKPTIVAMQGSAVGLGMTMTLPAVIRIGYEGGKYGFVFARRGITMESASSFFLPRLIGHSRALYLLTTGGVYPPKSPHFGPLFQETCPKAEQVLPRALELAAEIAENVSPLASYLNRELVWRSPNSAEETHLVDSAVLYHIDQKEGVGAFFEKRKPNFKATLEEDGPEMFPWWADVDTGSRPKAAKGFSKL
ncbi:AF-toxin biosynthesis 3-1 [Hyphodiscus hymeniophilus]|uniref:AF-toxin biosynthesis 3-1 n=1 Tax=Hyphodiscus hymeniophilus TaxID=353542 RepID=A0A9P6SNR4_9HELO|nr:AF-toxin biosynthesis 3-1 [Hyphodiscus hymeniophilus]